MELSPERCRVLLSPQLSAGEEIHFLCHGIERRWWMVLAGLTRLLWRHYLVAATDGRLLLLRLGWDGEARECEGVPWDDLDDARLGPGLLTRPLEIEAPARGLRHRLELPRLSALPRNWDAAEGVVATWTAKRSQGRRAVG